MSKSKGNVLDPIDIIDGIDLKSLIHKRTSNLMLKSVRDKIAKMTQQEFPDGIKAYGADALRFTYCSLASNNRTVRFDMMRVEGYRNFCNKLWNASRYVLINTDDEKFDFGDGAFQYSPADQWILSRLQRVKESAHQYFSNYRFDLLANLLYDFVWHEYCDWYLELSKPILYDDKTLAAMKRGTRRTLIHVLDQILKLLHPVIPFITEEIWMRLSKLTSQNGESIMLSQYPLIEREFINDTIEKEFDFVQKVIQSIRTIRSEMNINPGKLLPVLIKNYTKTTEELLKKHNKTFISIAKLSKITCCNETSVECASSIVDGVEILIPMKGFIDKENELIRLQKEIKKLQKDRDLALKKLENTNFVSNAPEEIITKVKEKLYSVKENLEKLNNHKILIERL